MERILSQDERIRRAQEIYARRQNVRERTTRATVNISSKEKPKNFRLLKKLILQAIICVLIYYIFYLINTTNYSFSKDTLNKTDELISQEVDFIAIYNNISKWIGDYISNLNLKNNNAVSENNIEENQLDNKQMVEEEQTKEKTKADEEEQSAETNSEGQSNIIESSEVEKDDNKEIAITDNDEDTNQEEIKEVELSETDRIKQNYSFIVPVSRKDII